jgi:cytochrome P450
MEKYVSNADKFKPERWIKGQQEGERLHRFASLPYGHGARMCLGRRFADLEMQILLAKMIRKYTVEFHHKPLGMY